MEDDEAGGFKHSAKVPRLFKVCASIITLHEEKGNSLKNLVFNGDGKGKKHPNVKALMGLCSAVVENKEEIEKMIADSQILTKEVPLSKNRNLARVLIAELVWGKGDLPPQCQAKPIVSVLKYKQFFTRRENHQKAKASKVPRWVRINTLKISPQKIDTELKKEGFRKLTCTNKKTYPEFLEMVKGLEKGFYVEDYHLKGLLLAFAPGTEFHQNRLYKDGSMVLQDKASCFTVAALNPPKGCRVLDACASPGMKTTQAAAATQAPVLAIERDGKRCKTLIKTVKKHAPKVKVVNSDFLKVDPTAHKDIEAIVLDPSCSGSGIREAGTTDLSDQRLESLSNMQATLLSHALSFPGLKTLAYSTCSIRAEENELVVSKVLGERRDFRLRKALPQWPRRGDPSATDQPDMFVRADPDLDLCHGFFVAVIEKVPGFYPQKSKDKRQKPLKLPTKKDSSDHDSTDSEKETNAVDSKSKKRKGANSFLAQLEEHKRQKSA